MIEVVSNHAKHYKALATFITSNFTDGGFPIKGELPILPGIKCQYSMKFSNEPIDPKEMGIPENMIEWDPLDNPNPSFLSSTKLSNTFSNSSVLSNTIDKVDIKDFITNHVDKIITKTIEENHKI